MMQWLDHEFTLTKRHLGVLLVIGGTGVLVLAVVAELINTQTSDFGTVQKLVSVLGVLSLVVGVTLLPLGDHPA